MNYLIFLSLVAALGGILFGYDTAVISGTIIQVSQQFGLTTLQQGWYVGCALIGSILGVSCAGIISDRFGRRITMFVSSVLFLVSALGCAICMNFDQLVIYRIIGGVGIGVASIVSPLYISEISIAAYRGRLVSLYQLAITMGFLTAYLTNFYLLNTFNDHYIFSNTFLHQIFNSEIWRGMLGMEVFPAMLFMVVICFIPESPRWLIIKGKDHKAAHIFSRIYGNMQSAMKQVNETKQVITAEVKSDWRLLLTPGFSKALLIGISLAILGQFMGVNAVLYYGPTIFQENGLSGGDSLMYQVIIGCVNFFTTLIALLIIDKIGRKKLVYYGVSGMIVSLLIITFYFYYAESLHIHSYMLLCGFMFYIFCSAISISAVIFVLLSEMYPAKVRGIAMSVAGLSLWVGTYLIGQLTPWMLKTLTPAGTFLLFALVCIPYLLIVWKLLPETAGKTLEEIEMIWQKKDK